jgi:hypothetical protein
MCQLNILRSTLFMVYFLSFLINPQHFSDNQLHDMFWADFLNHHPHELLKLLDSLFLDLADLVLVIWQGSLNR